MRRAPSEEAPPPGNGASSERLPTDIAWGRSILAILPPIFALVVQRMVWPLVRPSVWFLMYPAVFFSSWIGGLRGAVVASAIAAVGVLWVFIPPEHSFVATPGQYLAVTIFFATGVAFGLFHDRLRRANQRTAAALATSERANTALKQAVNERRIFAALIENSSDFIGIADPAGRPVYLNPAGRRMVGLGPDQPVENTAIPDYYPPSERAFAADVIVKAMVEKGHWQGETTFRNWQTEATIPVSDTHFMIREPETGDVLGMGTVTRDISDIKQARDDAESAHRQLERANRAILTLVEQAPDAIFVADLDGRYTDANEAACRLTGYSRDELLDKTILDLIPPDSVERLEREREQLMEGHDMVSEWTLRRKDGTCVPVEVSARILSDGRWQGFVRDISVRKRLEAEKTMQEEKRRLAEAKASGIVSVSADAIISIDDRQRITLFNEGAEKIFGYSREEAIGAPLDILIPERFRAVHRQHVERFGAGDTTARPMGERESRIYGLRKSGEEFPADAAISRLRIDDTTILTVALRDVTERHRLASQQELLSEMGSVVASTLELGAILTSVGQLVTRSFADASIVYAVEESGEILRLEVAVRDPAKDWIRAPLARRRIDRSRAPELWAELEAGRAVLIPQVPPEMRTSSAESDEDRRALNALGARSVIVAPLLAHGRLVGALSLISSSPTRTYETADVPFVEQIAQRAAFAVDNAQLYAKARRAVQTRDEVLGVVAHDLRNPLGAILVQAGLLRRIPSDPERRVGRAADSIGRSAERMNRLIQDLLDVARLEEGQLSVQPRWVAASQVLAEAVNAQQALATAASLDLEIDASSELPEVWADHDRLLQIFENLIGNALKFTGAGGVVRVGAAPRDGEVLFWVRDTGPGISDEDLPRVFDRFWQLRKGTQRGAGLGLPIVKGLVEAHGGRVWVESALGHGTTFFFTIRAAAQAPLGASEAAHPGS